MEANNVETMREALRAALDLIFDMQNADRSPLSHQAYAVKRKIKAALARPLRECDVGTAEEQAARMRAFCAKNGLRRDGSYRCENCGLLHEFRCELTWAQMPYEEGGVK